MSKFEEVYSNLYSPVAKFIAKRTSAPPDVVEDILSNTMIAAWKGWGTFRNKSSYFTWICKIALNKIADYYRSRVNRNSELFAPLIDSLIEPNPTNHEEKMALDELRIAVASWLNLIPAENRRILHLKYWEEATNAEIAKILSITPKAVESKLYRARKSLASAVAKEGGRGL